MRARARLAVAADRAPGDTRVTELRSDPPLVLRPTRVASFAAMPFGGFDLARALVVSLAAGAAGPLGGDDVRLDVAVGAGATLVVRGVSASVVLPGRGGEGSRTSVDVRVGAGGTVVWLPGAVIATRRCHHDASTVIALEDGARLLAREELVLGRHAETAGSLCQSLRVTLAGRALLHQDLRIGPDAPGWDGPAVAGRHRALGAVVVVDPAWSLESVEDGGVDVPADTAVFRLEGPGVLVSSAAGDAHTLRSQLDAAVARCGQGITSPLLGPSTCPT